MGTVLLPPHALIIDNRAYIPFPDLLLPLLPAYLKAIFQQYVELYIEVITDPAPAAQPFTLSKAPDLIYRLVVFWE